MIILSRTQNILSWVSLQQDPLLVQENTHILLAFIISKVQADANTAASSGSAHKASPAPRFPRMEPCRRSLRVPIEAPVTSLWLEKVPPCKRGSSGSQLDNSYLQTNLLVNCLSILSEAFFNSWSGRGTRSH